MSGTVSPAAPRKAPRVVRAGLVAAGCAAAANTAIYLGAVGLGVFSGGFARRGPEMTLGPILLVSVIAALTGAGVYRWLRMRVGRPERVFLTVSCFVLLFSFVAPAGIHGLTAAQLAVLEMMHFVVAASVVWALLGWSPEGERDRPRQEEGTAGRPGHSRAPPGDCPC